MMKLIYLTIILINLEWSAGYLFNCYFYTTTKWNACQWDDNAIKGENVSSEIEFDEKELTANIDTLDLIVSNLNALPSKQIKEHFPKITVLGLKMEFAKLDQDFIGESFNDVKELVLNQIDRRFNGEGDEISFQSNIFGNFPALTELTVNGPVDNESFKGAKNLTILDFSSSVNNLNEEILSSLTELETLTINVPTIETISENLFENNPKIKSLKFNYISFLPEKIFSHLKNLEDLNLMYNNLETLNENSFKYNTKLQKLNLGFNELAELPETLFETLVNLDYLSLRFNKLENLNENLFRNLQSLKELDLRVNKLTNIPEKTFENLVNLQRLDLELNKLKSLNENLFANNLKLETIILKGNYIKHLPVGMFAKLSNLKYLIIRKHYVENFSDVKFVNYVRFEY